MNLQSDRISLKHILSERIFVIAEIANAHQGNFDQLLELIKACADSKADAVKFQKYTAAELHDPSHDRYAHFKRMEFSIDEWQIAMDLARSLNLLVISDVFGKESASVMEAMGVDGYKIHSSDIINFSLLEQVASYGRPTFLSCGGSTFNEISNALNCLTKYGCSEIALMHGFQAFPTMLNHTELKVIETLKSTFNLPVGFADHIDGESKFATTLPLLGIAAGASIIEKHITLDRSKKEIDYYSSLNPNEFKLFVEDLRLVEPALGSGNIMTSDAEKAYRVKMKKSAVLNQDLQAGQILLDEMVEYKRIEISKSPVSVREIVGRAANKEIAAGTPISYLDFKHKVVICIAARLHSTRLKEKCLLPLHEDQSVLEFLITRMKSCRNIDEIILCTSTDEHDKKLGAVAQKAGIPIVYGSPDNVMERFLKAATVSNADFIVRVTGDNPLTDPAYLDSLVEFALDNNLDFASGKSLPSGTGAEVISVNALRRANMLAERPDLSEYMSWFLDSPNAFNVGIYPVPDDFKKTKIRLTIDHVEDFEVVRELVNKLYVKNPAFNLFDILEYAKSHPAILELNKNISAKIDRETINTRLDWSKYQAIS